jgi:AbrB family looped-hinge helix DNA binding protein
MATVKVSPKGRVVIPAALREKYRIEPGERVRIVDYGGVLSLGPSMEEPVRESRGILEGRTGLTRALLGERRRERQREASYLG